ncbi:MAG TPA: hypothetical protein VGM69_13510 [Chloroflexota bacterium]|jgi:hypothetical protein
MDRRPFALALLLGAGLAAWMLGAGSLGAADATVTPVSTMDDRRVRSG